MTNKMGITLRLVYLRETIERWISEDAFKDAGYSAEAQRLLDESIAEEVFLGADA